jgi:hypothetical protein
VSIGAAGFDTLGLLRRSMEALRAGSTPRRPARRAGVRSWLRACFMGQLLALASACVMPAKARELVDTGFRTPEQTLRSFQVFLRSDLPEKEYLAFSAGFRRRNGMSSLTYAEARERLFREKPWLRHFARAEVVAQWSGGPGSEGVHFIDARVFRRTIRVKLVREDFFEIWAGEDRLADGETDFEHATRLERSARGARFAGQVVLEDPPPDLSGASWFTVGREWKIDDLYEPQADEPVPEAAPRA